MSDRQQKIGEIMARAWKDENFKKNLISDPKGTLSKAGLQFPANLKLSVHEDTADTVHIVIPRNPANSELSDEALNEIAGGTHDTVLDTTCQDHCW